MEVHGLTIASLPREDYTKSMNMDLKSTMISREQTAVNLIPSVTNSTRRAQH